MEIDAKGLDEVPGYLPPFPDPHTFRQSAVIETHKMDDKAKRKMIIKEKRQVESSLVKLDRIIKSSENSETS